MKDFYTKLLCGCATLFCAALSQAYVYQCDVWRKGTQHVVALRDCHGGDVRARDHASAIVGAVDYNNSHGRATCVIIEGSPSSMFATVAHAGLRGILRSQEFTTQREHVLRYLAGAGHPAIDNIDPRGLVHHAAYIFLCDPSVFTEPFLKETGGQMPRYEGDLYDPTCTFFGITVDAIHQEYTLFMEHARANVPAGRIGQVIVRLLGELATLAGEFFKEFRPGDYEPLYSYLTRTKRILSLSREFQSEDVLLWNNTMLDISVLQKLAAQEGNEVTVMYVGGSHCRQLAPVFSELGYTPCLELGTPPANFYDLKPVSAQAIERAITLAHRGT